MNKDNQLISERYKTILLKENEQKVLTKEDIEHYAYIKDIDLKINDLNKIGDPEWGYWTQEDRDNWRKFAEDYAGERGVFGRGVEMENLSDEDLQFEIQKYNQDRYENFFWDLYEKLGLKDKEKLNEIGGEVDNLYWYFKKYPRDFDKDLEEANKRLFF